MQIVEVYVGFSKSLQLLQPVLEEVGFLSLGPKHQEILLVLIPVVVVGGGNDDDPPRILVDLNRMLLIIMILQIAVFSHVLRKTLIDT